VRGLLKELVPLEWRRFLRHGVSQASAYIRDAPADLIDAFWPGVLPDALPPPRLRSRVGQRSRKVFRRVGREGSEQILAAFQRLRRAEEDYPAWLDFGCGCGRLARYFAAADAPVSRLEGVDVDPDLVGWTGRHIRGRFATMRPSPPLAFAAGTFDVVYANSIFTHYTEPEQQAWLIELARVLRPGGLFFATTLSPIMTSRFPGLTVDDTRLLGRDGFLCANRNGEFGERVAFHAPAYLERVWGKVFRMRLYEPQGFLEFHDLSSWEKPAST
jgi:SAM-dependent methyltransferase